MMDTLLPTFLMFIAIAITIVLAKRYFQLQNMYNAMHLEKAQFEEKCEHLHNIETKYNNLMDQYSALDKEKAILLSNLEQERKNLSEKIELLNEAKQNFTETFKSIGYDIVAKNNQSFIELAKSVFETTHETTKSELALNVKSVNEVVLPIKNTLKEVDEKLMDIEKARVGSYEALKQQISELILTQNTLKTETRHLVSALKTSSSFKGNWGEMQLRRTVEIAGMLEHCDFNEQVHCEADDIKCRPDMIVHLPQGGNVVIDAKAPLSAYLKSTDETDEDARNNLLKEYVSNLKKNIVSLSNKKYWSHNVGPEFVVMFIPGELFLSVAIQQDPELIEFAMQKGIVMASPTILLALLRTIAIGWKQDALAKNAKEIIKSGQKIYEKLLLLTGHIDDLGKNIHKSVLSYNKAVGSFDSGIQHARRLQELTLQEKEIEHFKIIEQIPTQLSHSESEKI